LLQQGVEVGLLAARLPSRLAAEPSTHAWEASHAAEAAETAETAETSHASAHHLAWRLETKYSSSAGWTSFGPSSASSAGFRTLLASEGCC
jgi:hypothetical protein